ncbi:MAG: two-component system sensor histidine kinase NtrB [Bradymonadaceae bacterium]
MLAEEIFIESVSLQSLADPIITFNGECIVRVNEALIAFLGLNEPEDILGRSIFELIDAKYCDPLRKYIEGVRNGREPKSPVEVSWCGTGARPLSGKVTLVQHDHPEEIIFTAIIRDTTMDKRSTSETINTERAVTMDLLAAGVGHEINNPLAYLSANLDFVRRALSAWKLEDDDPRFKLLDEMREALHEAIEGAGRIRNIVQDLKSYSQSTDTEFIADLRGVDVDVILEKAINVAWSEICHRARLIREFEPVGRAMGDPTRLGQVFLNLLLNAAQAIVAGDVEGNTVTVRLYEKDGEVVVEVEDTGHGISQAHIKRLYEPFFTTRLSEGGTGLGLSISKRIIETCGGRIEVKSVPEEGSLFRVILRRAEQA